MRRLALLLVVTAAASCIARAEWSVQRPDMFDRADGVDGSLRGIAFADDHNGWAVGDGAVILRTEDGGGTWTLVDVDEQARRQFWDVLPVGPDAVWIAGTGGLIMSTADGGLTWTVAQTGTGNRLTTVMFTSDERGYAAGDNETLLVTADAGVTWETVSSARRARVGDSRTVFESLAFPMPNIGWTVGSSGAVERSEDSGLTWAYPDTDLDAVENLFSIVATSPSDLWIVGQEAAIFRSSDAGSTWERMENDAEDDYYDLYDVAVHPADPSHGWAVGDGGVILHTGDGGETWLAEDAGTRHALYSVAVSPSGSAYAAGAWGVILASIAAP